MNAAQDITLFDKLGYQPSRVIRVFGMRRSGNHAVINWLMRNVSDVAVFLNNCDAGKCPAETARAVEVNGIQMSLDAATVPEAISGVPQGGVLLISYEDFMPDPGDSKAGVTPGLPEECDCVDIVLFRSFMNWSASLLRKLQSNESLDLMARLRTMIVAMDKYCDALELVQLRSGPLRPISYDRWVARGRYRARLLDALGLELKDNSLGAVQRYGGGSSFQKSTRSAKDLSPHDRWQLMVNDPEYQILLLTASQHDELGALMQEVMPQDAAMLASYLTQARFPYQVEIAEDGGQA